MNLNNNPTTSQLANLLKSCKDEEAHHILWVDLAGDVHVTPLPEGLTPGGWEKKMGKKVKFRYETYNRGNDYVGPQAAKDQDYLDNLLADLNRDWSNDVTGYV